MINKNNKIIAMFFTFLFLFAMAGTVFAKTPVFTATVDPDEVNSEESTRISVTVTNDSSSSYRVIHAFGILKDSLDGWNVSLDDITCPSGWDEYSSPTTYWCTNYDNPITHEQSKTVEVYVTAPEVADNTDYYWTVMAGNRYRNWDYSSKDVTISVLTGEQPLSMTMDYEDPEDTWTNYQEMTASTNKPAFMEYVILGPVNVEEDEQKVGSFVTPDVPVCDSTVFDDPRDAGIIENSMTIELNDSNMYNNKYICFRATSNNEVEEPSSLDVETIYGLSPQIHHLDTIAPTTELIISDIGESAAQEEETEETSIYNKYKAVSFEAEDNEDGSDINKTYYSILNNSIETTSTLTSNCASLENIFESDINLEEDGNYTINYCSVDNAGNEEEINEDTFVIDTTAPVITLQGSSTIYIQAGNDYVELGATVTDNLDENPTLQITHNVNTNLSGSYTATYKATDWAGNTSTKTRNVEVVGGTGGSSGGGGGGGGAATQVVTQTTTPEPETTPEETTPEETQETPTDDLVPNPFAGQGTTTTTPTTTTTSEPETTPQETTDDTTSPATGFFTFGNRVPGWVGVLFVAAILGIAIYYSATGFSGSKKKGL